ncbi:MAG: hypothetical protein LAO76_25670 [Acidobacteriia bacterium]|nr:hypothetical protein [Terriglobia bacterium]
MFLLSHRSLRGFVLGLMFFLAGGTICWSDSYDPDPYDDIPPVVTVDFNYVVPSQITRHAPNIQVEAPQRIAKATGQLLDFALPQLLIHNGIASLPRQGPPNLLIPLRR